MTLNSKYHRLKKTGHLLFWLFSLVFALIVFYVVTDHQLGITPEIVLMAIIINFGFAFAVYTNFYILIPKLLKKKSYIFYIFWLIITLSISSLIIISLFLFIKEGVFTKQLFSTHFFTSAVYVTITSLAKFVTDWIELQDISLRYNKVEREKLEAELNTLKAQINPHFLFNSLNNIYSLSLVNSEKTPQLILKLSDLMRHVLYESREDYIPLRKEVEFIGNFIELQRIRLNEKVDIQFHRHGDVSNGLIIPLILEPFVDNAFKHGPRSNSQHPFIHISLKIEANQLFFEVSNSCDEQETAKNDSAHGIGLRNARQRLAYLYKKREYDLDINKKENTFIVRLRINLKNPENQSL